MKKIIPLSALFAALTLGTSCSSFADSSYLDGTTFKIGAVNINPHSEATPISGPYTPVDALSLKVESQSTVYFGLSYDLTEHWQADLAMGVPPKHRVNVVILNPSVVTPEMAAANGQAGAYVTQLAPTAFLNYVFGSKESIFRPYVGLGINYTKFTKAETTQVADNLNGGPTTMGLTSSKGAAAQVGFSQKITKEWAFFGSYTTAKVHTDMTTNTLGIERTSEIKFRPAVITLAIGRSF
jgi:outer membrane protein